MEKSVSVALTNEKVCNYLPHDLVLFILSKLPLKSLKRFHCVCKSWSLLFENPHFINMYIDNVTGNNHSYYDDTFLILHKLLPKTHRYRTHCEFYWLSGEKFENRVKLDWPPPFQNDDTNIYIVGSISINGILCLKQGFKCTRQLVLWNPTTRESKVIPPSPLENVPPDRNAWFVLHGFSYDHVSDDYKVIQMTDFCPDYSDDEGEDLKWENRSYDPLWEIYSLKSNSWKKLKFDMRNCYYYSELRGIGLYVDGFFHWVAKSESKYDEECLLSFDFSNEVVLTTPMPSSTDDSIGRFAVRFLVRHLVLLNGSIALISTYSKTNNFRISILGKLGVRESWINLFNVTPLPFIGFPIGVGSRNNIVFLIKSSKELSWIDLRTRMIEKLGFKGDRNGCHIGKYKKSFLDIGRINN
jgi:molecular chaperone HtpG